jgi:hypothetical protein
VTGGIKPNDDLWLDYDFWASADDTGTTRRADVTRRATMRNEISAAANKIWPNGDNKVPDQYKQAIAAAFGVGGLAARGKRFDYFLMQVVALGLQGSKLCLGWSGRQVSTG